MRPWCGHGSAARSAPWSRSTERARQIGARDVKAERAAEREERDRAASSAAPPRSPARRQRRGSPAAPDRRQRQQRRRWRSRPGWRAGRAAAQRWAQRLVVDRSGEIAAERIEGEDRRVGVEARAVSRSPRPPAAGTRPGGRGEAEAPGPPARRRARRKARSPSGSSAKNARPTDRLQLRTRSALPGSSSGSTSVAARRRPPRRGRGPARHRPGARPGVARARATTPWPMSTAARRRRTPPRTRSRSRAGRTAARSRAPAPAAPANRPRRTGGGPSDGARTPAGQATGPEAARGIDGFPGGA